MPTRTHDIVAKLWNLCNVLKDDGVTYHQYVTELTYLLFLKMAKVSDDNLAAGRPGQVWCWAARQAIAPAGIPSGLDGLVTATDRPHPAGERPRASSR